MQRFLDLEISPPGLVDYLLDKQADLADFLLTSGASWSPWILEKSTRYEISDTPIEEPQHRKPLISGVRYELAPLVDIPYNFS
jgi:hypothetical protein